MDTIRYIWYQMREKVCLVEQAEIKREQDRKKAYRVGYFKKYWEEWMPWLKYLINRFHGEEMTQGGPRWMMSQRGNAVRRVQSSPAARMATNQNAGGESGKVRTKRTDTKTIPYGYRGSQNNYIRRNVLVTEYLVVSQQISWLLYSYWLIVDTPPHGPSL